MRISFRPAPWYPDGPAKSWTDVQGFLDDAWRQAAVEFYAERAARVATGRKAPKGVQPYLNSVLADRFEEAGWEGSDGRFFFADRWIRVTFRHQMSLGSDFTDAIKVVRKSGFKEVMIAAATRSFLSVISPNDAAALTSYEKLWAEAVDLDECLDIPLLLGSLEPTSTLPPEVARVIYAPRPRDVYVPRQTSGGSIADIDA